MGLETTSTAPPATHDLRNLVACTDCRLLKTLDQFKENGCENCDHHADPQTYTTSHFSGVTLVLDSSEKSWIAKRLDLDKRAIGMYALDIVKDDEAMGHEDDE
ncbi:Transcription initiation Spt4 like protein [Aduncisulcus paluster]|uniref:Transcription initiation Spt4 like protein n=1 Tax=Aduncisulcus paluster TaxID=2918883 RepID=A0ABQ5K9F4_9EUKA|nr:Transcription initiation Spt4 like protein [Aduncisulcus paluster]